MFLSGAVSYPWPAVSIFVFLVRRTDDQVRVCCAFRLYSSAAAAVYTAILLLQWTIIAYVTASSQSPTAVQLGSCLEWVEMGEVALARVRSRRTRDFRFC